MDGLTLADLVRNRTMSPAMAATLAVAAEERRSMLFVAIPRMAGKTTVMRAALACAPPGTAFHHLSRSAGPGLGIPPAPDGGYLVMSEISDIGFPEYLWGHEVRLVFEALDGGGLSLATSLHAGSLEEAFEVIAGHNAVPDRHAARIDLVVYIRSLGYWDEPTRRAVASIHEVEGVTGGRPAARLLHCWVEAGDRFEAVQEPARVGTAATLAHHLLEFSRCLS